EDTEALSLHVLVANMDVGPGGPARAAVLVQPAQVGGELVAVTADGIGGAELERGVATHAIAEATEDPVLVVAVELLGGGAGGEELHTPGTREIVVHAPGQGRDFLRVLAWLVGKRGARVVEGEGVVAVVRVDVQEGEIGAEVLAWSPHQ